MKFTRVLIVLVWLMAVPGCVVTGRAVSQSLNQNPHTREGAVEVSSDADAQEFYPIAFLPRGNVEEAYFLLQKGRQGRLLDQQEGTLSIDAASLNDLNDRLAVEASDMNGRVEIESGPDGPSKSLSRIRETVGLTTSPVGIRYPTMVEVGLCSPLAVSRPV